MTVYADSAAIDIETQKIAGRDQSITKCLEQYEISN